MIRRTINVDDYWKVIVYYSIDYNLFHIIYSDLKRIGCTDKQIKSIYNNMYHKDAKAVTVSSIDNYVSIVLFNKHKDYYDYINSIIHEAEHVKQSILYAYNIKDEGENPAYTIGYIGMKMMHLLL